MNANLLTLDSISLSIDKRVRVSLDSASLRNRRDIADWIVADQGKPERLAVYVVYAQAIVRETQRLKMLHSIFHSPMVHPSPWKDDALTQRRAFSWDQLSKLMSMQVVALPNDPEWVQRTVDDALGDALDHDVCFIDLSQFEETIKKIDVATFQKELDAALTAVDIESNAVAQVQLDALLQGETEAAGWADEGAVTAALGVDDVLDVTRRARDRLLKSETWLNSREVAIFARAQVVDSNPAQFASRLRRQRCLFGVRFRGEYLHPKFQLLPSGDVHPSMAALLAILPTTDANWNAAFWLYQPTGKLGGRRPADVFATDPDAVIAAARADFGGDNPDGVAIVTAKDAARGE